MPGRLLRTKWFAGSGLLPSLPPDFGDGSHGPRQAGELKSSPVNWPVNSTALCLQTFSLHTYPASSQFLSTIPSPANQVKEKKKDLVSIGTGLVPGLQTLCIGPSPLSSQTSSQKKAEERSLQSSGRLPLPGLTQLVPTLLMGQSPKGSEPSQSQLCTQPHPAAP